MPLSYQEITNPSSTSFTVNFEFINLADIKAAGKQNSGSTWTELSVTNPATNSSGVTTVTVANAGTYSSAGAVRIYRASTQAPLVDFQSGSRLSESDLDTAYRQGLFAAQEVRENAKEQIAVQGPVGDAGADGADATIGVGSIDLDKLSATGTKDATTFLRGDNTFATISSGETNAPYFLATGDASQTISSGSMHTVAYNVLEDSLDTASGYNTSTYTYTVQTGGAGFWFFQAATYFTGLSDGNQFDLNVYINGGNRSQTRQKAGGGMNATIQVGQLCKMDVGDYVCIKAFQNSGSDQGLTVSDNGSFFGGFRIAAI